VRSAEEMMEILEAFDLVGTYRGAAALVGCDHKTVARLVELRDRAGGGVPVAGLASARARGRFGGRPKKLTGEQIQMAAAMMQTKTTSVNQICATFQIGRTTLYKYVTPNGEIRKG